MWLPKLQGASSGELTGWYRSWEKERRSRVNHPVTAAPSIM